MQRFYDLKHKRLVYIESSATEHFWDEHWDTANIRSAALATPNSWVVRTTKEYLAPGARVLEGGCGQANHVYALQKNGFSALGVDFAIKTVEQLQEYVPEIRVELGDVRKLSFFEDESVDGYWSLGVIEHFWGGYESISKEMYRVLKVGGYLFLTFPYMSPLRQRKAVQGDYEDWSDDADEPKGFYQFALDHATVSSHFQEVGFELCDMKGLDAVKGFKDESQLMQQTVQKIYNGRGIVSKAIRYLWNKLFLHYSGHSCLLILKKI